MSRLSFRWWTSDNVFKNIMDGISSAWLSKKCILIMTPWPWVSHWWSSPSLHRDP
jgi:hypothetical protein